MVRRGRFMLVGRNHVSLVWNHLCSARRPRGCPGGGPMLFEEIAGRLVHPVRLQTGGEDALSGALGERGAYVVTPTRVVFFPRGHTVAASSAHLLVGDGSAAQIALAGGHAYVSEKT